MNTSPNASRGESEKTSSERPATFLLLTMADTTWRMFVPIIGALLLGRWIDGEFQTKPIFMILGIVIGTAVTAILIKNQLGRKE